MGATVGVESDKKAVNVEINVIPFIDLMSCLTAFLLVTAVWTQFAQINIKPKGLGKDATVTQDQNRVYASILVTRNEVWVGMSTGDIQRVVNDGDQHDWTGVKTVLDGYRQQPVFEGRQDIEVAAEDDVTYQDIISTMDTSIAAGFRDIGFIDPQSLTVRFKE